MKFIFTDKITELVLPVTPQSFRVPRGTNIETINIHDLGDVNMGGYGALANIKVECMFPAKDYPFVESDANTDDPYSYVNQLDAWRQDNTVLRYIISDTPFNLPVLIEEIVPGEDDGTGDVYATITLREYRQLTAVQVESETENIARAAEVEAEVETPETYTVEAGDTLSAICRLFYGDASLYPQLASYNGIANANLITVGQVIELPDIEVLKATQVTTSYTAPETVKNWSDGYMEWLMTYGYTG